MIFDDLIAALDGLGVDGESYVLRMGDEINDSATFIKSYNCKEAISSISFKIRLILSKEYSFFDRELKSLLMSSKSLSL